MGAPRDRPDQLGGEVGAVLVGLSGLAAVIRFAVIVLPLTAPLTCTALPTGNCWAVLGVRLVPNCVCGVMVTVYAVLFLALTVQVEPFSAAIVPTSPWPWPALPGAAAAGGAVDVGGAVVAGVALGLLDPPEHAATPIATEAPTIPTATLVPIRARSQPATRVIGHSFLDQVQHDPAVPKLCSPVMDRLGASKLQATSELAGKPRRDDQEP
jgi:hypothetical protein